MSSATASAAAICDSREVHPLDEYDLEGFIAIARHSYVVASVPRAQVAARLATQPDDRAFKEPSMTHRITGVFVRPELIGVCFRAPGAVGEAERGAP